MFLIQQHPVEHYFTLSKHFLHIEKPAALKQPVTITKKITIYYLQSFELFRELSLEESLELSFEEFLEVFCVLFCELFFDVFCELFLELFCVEFSKSF